MRVSDVMGHKAGDRPRIVTIGPTATVSELVELLDRHRIGAVVVTADEKTIDGIISERDVVRALASDGPDAMSMSLDRFMTTDVRTCSSTDELRNIAEKMTTGRFRHLPVVDDGELVGIVSIGDVVKNRIDELETQTDHLVDYLFTG